MSNILGSRGAADRQASSSFAYRDSAAEKAALLAFVIAGAFDPFVSLGIGVNVLRARDAMMAIDDFDGTNDLNDLGMEKIPVDPDGRIVNGLGRAR
ncbi:hypothetical protein [Paenibacillus elgii]|uniref:hypothetical protein n=1 Tax=Paenibacillus elgii TaxID=189691 RepID=UPI000248BFD6|nr:hypothetical protein [Paenibacillus elgii]